MLGFSGLSDADIHNNKMFWDEFSQFVWSLAVIICSALGLVTRLENIVTSRISPQLISKYCGICASSLNSLQKQLCLHPSGLKWLQKTLYFQSGRSPGQPKSGVRGSSPLRNQIQLPGAAVHTRRTHPLGQVSQFHPLGLIMQSRENNKSILRTIEQTWHKQHAIYHAHIAILESIKWCFGWHDHFACSTLVWK